MAGVNERGKDFAWSQNGRELYHYSSDGKVMEVDSKPGAQFQFDAPKPLFEAHISLFNTRFEVTKDGRFLLPLLVEPEAQLR